MTSNKSTEWGGGSEAELAPVMRLIDFALVQGLGRELVGRRNDRSGRLCGNSAIAPAL